MTKISKNNKELWCHADTHITDRTLKNYLDVTHVNGVLIIECSEYVILPKLRYTKGLNIVIGSNVTLPNCDEVIGDICVQNKAKLTIGGKGKGVQMISLNGNAFLKMEKCNAIDSLRVLNGSTATLPALQRINDVLRVLDSNLKLDACESVGGLVEAEGNCCVEMPACLEVTRNITADGRSMIDMPQCMKVGGRVYAEEKSTINLSPSAMGNINKAAFSAGKIIYEIPIDYKAISTLCKADSVAIF